MMKVAKLRWLPLCSALVLTQVLAPASSAAADSTAARKLPHAAGEPVAVSIAEFRSGLMEISERGTTDMFITALARNGAFRVVERARLDAGVAPEKQLNGSGLSSGETAQQPLRAAEYLFEGAITEANTGENQHSSSIGVAGMSIGGGKNRDVIGIDVRIVEVATGDVVDVVSLRKTVKSHSAAVSGVGNLLATVLAQRGRSSPYTPDVNVEQQHKESVDAALRELIDESVGQLAARFQQ